MSYELVFWKRQPGKAEAAIEVYTALIAGQTVDGLQVLPIDDWLLAIAREFPGSTRERNGSAEWMIWEAPDQTRVFEVSWSDHHVRVDCRGLGDREMNRIIDIAATFGAPLYDPQTSERFDSGAEA
jgi:hypothetical protein